jgi:hypothetical protein
MVVSDNVPDVTVRDPGNEFPQFPVPTFHWNAPVSPVTVIDTFPVKYCPLTVKFPSDPAFGYVAPDNVSVPDGVTVNSGSVDAA